MKMMKQAMLGFLLLSASLAFPQQESAVRLELPRTSPGDEVIEHRAYTLSFNETCRVASWVAYELTAEETVAVVKRNNKFVPDPLLTCCTLSNSDYARSGFDKGHLAPSADMCFSYETMRESFYLSNMAPQDPSFNRGIWSKLEKQVRQWAVDNQAVYVVTGTVLTPGLPAIGADRITVPEYFYKVILDCTGPEVKGIGFILPNRGSDEPLQHFAVSIDSVERVTGTDFFYQLPDDQEKRIERTVAIDQWNWTSSVTSRRQKP